MSPLSFPFILSAASLKKSDVPFILSTAADRPGETVPVNRKTIERPAGRSMLVRYPAMADVVSFAIEAIRRWEVDDPVVLFHGAADLFCQVMDMQPRKQKRWSELRDKVANVDLHTPAAIDKRMGSWDWLSNQLVGPLGKDAYAMQQLGVVLCVTRLLRPRIRRPEAQKSDEAFEEWRERLCGTLDKVVGFYRDRPTTGRPGAG